MKYALKTSNIRTVPSSIVERIFINREIPVENIRRYLSTTDEEILPPESIARMGEGVKLLIKHIGQNSKIFIQIDSDCDGYVSSALLLNYLYILFPSFVVNNISYRIHDGKEHGLIPETIPKGTNLIILPDSSSSDFEQHKEMADKGVDILVIDHHEAEKISDHAVVINNQLCDYPTKSLSGVGMVYKFCSYIDKMLGKNYADLFLDLVALGIVADMMDLRDFETKHLVTKGIKNLRNPFFKNMVKTQSFSISRHGELDPFSISFYIAPQINATVRMGGQKEKMILFESMLDFKAYEEIPSTKRGYKGKFEPRVEQACRNCLNIKNRQTKARDEGLELIESIIKKDNLLEHKFLTIKIEPEYKINKNLTGLIANQLMAKYQRPVLLLNKRFNEETSQITWEGSGRGYDKSEFDNLREYLLSTGLGEYAAGHANALGFGIKDENFQEFITKVDEDLKDFNFTPCYKVDIIYLGFDFSQKDIIDLAELKSIWGQGVEEPLVAIENIKVTKENLTLMSRDKNPTLKIALPNGTSLIKFRSSEEEYQSLLSNSDLGCVTINVVGKCAINEWNGTVTAQILIEDYEVVGSSNYYF